MQALAQQGGALLLFQTIGHCIEADQIAGNPAAKAVRTVTALRHGRFLPYSCWFRSSLAVDGDGAVSSG